MNFTFLKDQSTMVEYKGALDVISKTFKSVGAWYENLISLIGPRLAFHFQFQIHLH